MPELPDVEILRRYVESTVLHRTVRAVEDVDGRLLRDVSASRLRDTLTGAELESTTRHGKWCFVRSEDGWLGLHFGMTGELVAWKSDPPDGTIPEHVALRLVLDDDTKLEYRTHRRLGAIALVEDVGRFVDEEDLGPDAWDVGQSALDEALARSRGSVKSSITNQALLAGIGNVYADEILYQTGVHPELPVNRLDEEDRRRLRTVMRRVLRTAIERDADPDQMPDGWLLPRREEGARCGRCDGRVEKTTVGGRSTYLCPSCQSRSRH